MSVCDNYRVGRGLAKGLMLFGCLALGVCHGFLMVLMGLSMPFTPRPIPWWERWLDESILGWFFVLIASLPLVPRWLGLVALPVVLLSMAIGLRAESHPIFIGYLVATAIWLVGFVILLILPRSPRIKAGFDVVMPAQDDDEQLKQQTPPQTYNQPNDRGDSSRPSPLAL